MFYRVVLTGIGVAVIFASSVAAQPYTNASKRSACHSTVFGHWNAGGGTEVTIVDCGDNTPCGTITDLLDPDLPDGNNKDPSLRSRALIGVQMLSGFRQSKNGWKRGRIYNPANGRTYGSSIRLDENGQLLVKGCIGPFCESQTWNRLSAEGCPDE